MSIYIILKIRYNKENVKECDNMIEEIMTIMDEIHYGYLDTNGINIVEKNPKDWDVEFEEIYHLLSPEELLEKKYGICYDQVELERFLLEERGIKSYTYFIEAVVEEGTYTHTFLVYEKANFYYWLEHSWGMFKGIHKYSSLKELLLDVKTSFQKSHSIKRKDCTFIYEYEKPVSGLGSHEFYEYCINSKLIKVNEPFYFYHVVDKDASLSPGLLSLQYMYDHQLLELFDKSSNKYRKGIVSYWELDKYKGSDSASLTREEILDALNLFRGEYTSSYIYFFKFPPYASLGSKMEEMLKEKDIYQININDEEVQKNILDIFYGYENNHGDSKKLTREYYEDVGEKEYFQNYEDSEERNFATLNHIAIAFKNDYCPVSFLEKISK